MPEVEIKLNSMVAYLSSLSEFTLFSSSFVQRRMKYVGYKYRTQEENLCASEEFNCSSIDCVVAGVPPCSAPPPRTTRLPLLLLRAGVASEDWLIW